MKYKGLIQNFIPSCILLFYFSFEIKAQTQEDSLHIFIAPSIIIEGKSFQPDASYLPKVQGTYIFSGIKNEVIDLSKKSVSMAEKVGRQIFAKVPGIFVYDMDGTGNQINISARGLDAHRGWEFNIRKDGVITNSDMYGYPASHYNIPMEAVEKIELVRGTGSLAYGAQFGGLINYITKKPVEDKKVSIENSNTIGSYGLISNHTSISGTLGKLKYSAWLNKKWLKGYRDNSSSSYNSEDLFIQYSPKRVLELKLNLSHSNYLTQLPGPLNDAMFQSNPRQSTRSRNYYNPDIYVPSFNLKWKISDQSELVFSISAVLGTRNSVLFDRPATVTDSIVPGIKSFNSRQVDIDAFNSYTSELRYIKFYSLGKNKNVFNAGVQGINNNLHRKQQGKGTAGSNYSLEIDRVLGWGRDLNYKSRNLALFAEHLWELNTKIHLNTGIRFELGNSDLSGKINYLSPGEVPNNIVHRFSLFGMNVQYDLSKEINFYCGWSQAYRPVILKDIIPLSIYEKSDKNLKDALGYNAEFGWRGSYKSMLWDITLYQLYYKNRLGTLAQTNSSGDLIIFKTNIGNSLSRGIELFFQKYLYTNLVSELSFFTSSSFIHAEYVKAKVSVGNKNVDITGNKVESTPSIISRNGLNYRFRTISFSTLLSYTAESFADAFNSRVPSSTGATGLVPSYLLVDINMAKKLSEHFKIQCNLNNVFNKQYFTKRPQFYPGPGIWPSDGRSASISVTYRF